MVFDREIEDSVGLFAMALSFASDACEEAAVVSTFCDFHGLRCYDYRRFQARQWGIPLRDIEEFVYLTTPQITIFNSPGYLNSNHTAHEFDLIRRSTALRRLVTVELGGSPLPATGIRVQSIQGFSSVAALLIVQPEGDSGAKHSTN